ncbi:MAG: hypothetical protein H5T61_10840 [Thermoflexales bacterium]|nr:hypothetical protein [Thermoflexales bacterium]
MKFEDLLRIVGDEPVFESAVLLAGAVDPKDVRRQLSRWVRDGRVYLLRRGLYTLAPPFQKVRPHPFVMANQMVRSSYVSCQSALAHYGLIPESVPATVSVTLRRPARWETVLGTFEFHRIQPALWYGYRWLDLGGQWAFVATPEKALLDLIYLHPGADSPAYLRELRLQNVERLNPEELLRLAEASGIPKLKRAAQRLAEMLQSESGEYETL